MNKIAFPLRLRMKRPEVAGLQTALQPLLDQGVIPPGLKQYRYARRLNGN